MCCAARFEEEEERGKREEAPKKAMEKMSGGTQGRAKSAGRGRECDRVVGKDGGRETDERSETETRKEKKRGRKRRRVTRDMKSETWLHLFLEVMFLKAILFSSKFK